MDIYDVLGIIFVVVSTTILLGGIKNPKSPEQLTIAEFEQNKSRALAIICPIIGLLVIGKTLYDLKSSSLVDPLIIHSFMIGGGIFLYGLYRWQRLPKENLTERIVKSLALPTSSTPRKRIIYQ